MGTDAPPSSDRRLVKKAWYHTAARAWFRFRNLIRVTGNLIHHKAIGVGMLRPLTIEMWYSEEAVEYSRTHDLKEFYDMIGCIRLAYEHGYDDLIKSLLYHFNGIPDFTETVVDGALKEWFFTQRIRRRDRVVCSVPSMLAVITIILAQPDFKNKKPNMAALLWHDRALLRNDLYEI
jgi:hypothetical protein